MLYTEMTKKAMKLCFDAHKDQVDKSGMPYIFHPLILAEKMTTEEEITVALLHDVVEDTNYTIEDLQDMGFSDTVIEALKKMTHDPAIPYMDYVKGISTNPIATKVKLADLRHNSDLNRLDQADSKAIARVKKYKSAIEFLESVAWQATK